MRRLCQSLGSAITIVATSSFHPQSVSIRAARPDDALSLSVLGMQVFLDTYATEGVWPATARKVVSYFSEAALQQAIASAQSLVLVAERAERLVGFAQVTLGATHELAPAGAHAELLRLYIQAPFLRCGIGTRLLAHTEGAACSAGVSVLWLTPWVQNHGALAFYATRGYSDFGPTYSPPFEGASYENRVYAKHLDGTA